MEARALNWAEPRLSRIMFLCTANHYQSRFCEAVFNHHATAQRLNWLAYSRALRESPATLNPGPMSRFAVEFSKSAGYGRRIICVCRTQRRSSISRRTTSPSPSKSPSIGFWSSGIGRRIRFAWNTGAMPDIDVLAPNVALRQLEDKVNIARLDETVLGRGMPACLISS